MWFDDITWDNKPDLIFVDGGKTQAYACYFEMAVPIVPIPAPPEEVCEYIFCPELPDDPTAPISEHIYLLLLRIMCDGLKLIVCHPIVFAVLIIIIVAVYLTLKARYGEVFDLRWEGTFW